MLSNEIMIPTLTTERLVIRALSVEDAPAIQLLRSNDIVNQFLDRPKTTTIQAAEEFIEKIHKGTLRKDCYYWAICCKNTNKLMGTTCLWNISEEDTKGEIGYELHPDYQGKGIMHEAVSAVIDFAFNALHFAELTATTKPENVASIKLLDKHGFMPDKNFALKTNEDLKGWVGYSLRNNLL